MTDYSELDAAILRLLSGNGGCTLREIQDRLRPYYMDTGLPRSTLHSHLVKLSNAHKIEFQSVGLTTVWSVLQEKKEPLTPIPEPLISASSTRWSKLTNEQLCGADYALRIAKSSPSLHGHALEHQNRLVREVKEEMLTRRK